MTDQTGTNENNLGQDIFSYELFSDLEELPHTERVSILDNILEERKDLTDPLNLEINNALVLLRDRVDYVGGMKQKYDEDPEGFKLAVGTQLAKRSSALLTYQEIEEFDFHFGLISPSLVLERSTAKKLFDNMKGVAFVTPHLVDSSVHRVPMPIITRRSNIETMKSIYHEEAHIWHYLVNQLPLEGVFLTNYIIENEALDVFANSLPVEGRHLQSIQEIIDQGGEVTRNDCAAEIIANLMTGKVRGGRYASSNSSKDVGNFIEVVDEGMKYVLFEGDYSEEFIFAKLIDLYKRFSEPLSEQTQILQLLRAVIKQRGLKRREQKMALAIQLLLIPLDQFRPDVLKDQYFQDVEVEFEEYDNRRDITSAMGVIIHNRLKPEGGPLSDAEVHLFIDQYVELLTSGFVSNTLENYKIPGLVVNKHLNSILIKSAKKYLNDRRQLGRLKQQLKMAGY